MAASVLALAACAAAAPASQAPASPPLAGASSAADHCPLPGHLAQWRADYCMATTGTDDLIAAGQCMERESQVLFSSDCVGKLEYKRRMCELAGDEGPRKKSVEACLADPGFMGSTVRNDGS